eukprot:TRINITY_DN27545_c0_g1_i1.p1 TRINITY_DN27545_c0_g1~~TRINITY_DN27545_c0_g1_i1.p1  ORF type:complete len:410 (-),score=50.05 TRINITY_DN27545_c0_g1_i1:315-1481(-)
MSASTACKFCQRLQPLNLFCGNQERRAAAGKPACCRECEQAFTVLRQEANLAKARSQNVGIDDGSPLLEDATAENQQFWEEAIHRLAHEVELGYDCREAHSWLPGMLSNWLKNEIKKSQVAAEATAIKDSLAADLVETPPEWLEEARSERILRYDTVKFPFEEIFQAIFETSSLEMLHQQELNGKQPPLCPTLFRAYVNAGIKRPREWRSSTKWETKYVNRFRQSEPYERFMETYHRFINEIIVPLVGHGELMYQCPPTLRCQMPSVVASCAPHRDSDYAAHHGAEINFWIPVTKAWGSNTLHVESQPGREDFHPLELCPGEMAIFNGSKCLHYTEANSTDRVRVSFDFRVIPKMLLKSSYPRLASKRHDIRGAATYLYEFLGTGSSE